LAFGGNLKHIKRFNNGILESKIKIRDKYIFGKSNIFTVSGSAEYTTPKINAEVNLEYIKVPASEYIGIDARAYYNISKKIGAFIDANYIHLKETDMIKGTTIQAGVIINM
jgi:predicted porin